MFSDFFPAAADGDGEFCGVVIHVSHECVRRQLSDRECKQRLGLLH